MQLSEAREALAEFIRVNTSGEVGGTINISVNATAEGEFDTYFGLVEDARALQANGSCVGVIPQDVVRSLASATKCEVSLAAALTIYVAGLLLNGLDGPEKMTQCTGCMWEDVSPRYTVTNLGGYVYSIAAKHSATVTA